MVVEDANEHGQLGALIVTKGETVISVQTMLERVKANNSALEKTQVVVIDKDFAQVQAIKLVMPHAQIQLCVFHVLKAVRKEILKLVSKQSQRQVYSLMHSLVYAIQLGVGEVPYSNKERKSLHNADY